MSIVENQVLDSNQTYTDSYTTTWIRYPYGVRLESDPRSVLNSVVELEKFIMEEDMDKQTLSGYLSILKGSMQSDEGGVNGLNKYGITSDREVNYYFNYPNFSDTRVGCNDAINPYWQFNRDDDICPPSLVPKKFTAGNNLNKDSRYKSYAEHAAGMGRVYAETYDAQQQIVWFEAGVPKFTNLIAYYRDAMDADVATAMNNGSVISILGQAINIAIKVTAFTITFGLLSVLYIARWTDRMVNERITKYYSFESTMGMYYAMVNSMLQYTATTMGIHPLTLNQAHGPTNGANMIEQLDAAPKNPNQKTYTGYQTVTTEKDGVTETHFEKKSVTINESSTTSEYKQFAGIPELFRNGPDIFKIMNRKSRLIDQQNTLYSVEDLMRAQANKDSDLFLEPEKEPNFTESATGAQTQDMQWYYSDSDSSWWSTLKGSIMGSGNYVGFKVERGVGPSESFSNETGPTGLAEKINNESRAKRDEQDNNIFGRSLLGRAAQKGLDAITEGGDIKKNALEKGKEMLVEGAIGALAGAVGFDIGSVLVTGNGFLEIPEVWKSSSAGARSYSMSFKLRSRYGDPVSIFQSIYIPLFLLIALAVPKAAGSHSYTSPFLIRAYCRGMFNIPLGIVTSLTIERGRDEFGWSSQYLPLEVNVSMTIKDLSPQLFISMNCGVIDTFTKNTTMQSYLDTLSALGLRDMIYWYPKIVRKMNAALATARSTIFNPSYHGTRLGKSKLGKMVSALVPYKVDRASRR